MSSARLRFAVIVGTFFSRPGSIAEMFSQIDSTWNALDVLFRNTGVAGPRTLAWAADPHAARVWCFTPGALRTSINATGWQNPTRQQDLIAKIAMGRVGELGNVAGAALVRASDVAGYVTGTGVFIEHGMAADPASSRGG